jgi:hypothetical protein
MFELSKAADLNLLVQGGHLYWAFHFSKGSLPNIYTKTLVCLWIIFSTIKFHLNNLGTELYLKLHLNYLVTDFYLKLQCMYPHIYI